MSTADGRRPRLTPAIADVRRAVRESLAPLPEGPIVVALSGGPDSLALAAAAAFEGPRAGREVVAVIVDHRLQPGSAEVAARTAALADGLGIDPVLTLAVEVGTEGGPENAARLARYAALEEAARSVGAVRILTGHTRDDQAETVLLGLARGSGPVSLAGMRADTGRILRPLLGLPRATTHAFCVDSGLEPWRDPQNEDPRFARSRVRHRVLPVLEAELGPGIAEALARTADQLREDSDALDQMIEELLEDICEHAEAGIAVSVEALAANPAALRHRIIRAVVAAEFGVALGRAHVLAAAALVTAWHGQAPLDLPGIRVARRDGLLVFTAAGSRE